MRGRRTIRKQVFCFLFVLLCLLIPVKPVRARSHDSRILRVLIQWSGDREAIRPGEVSVWALRDGNMVRAGKNTLTSSMGWALTMESDTRVCFCQEKLPGYETSYSPSDGYPDENGLLIIHNRVKARPAPETDRTVQKRMDHLSLEETVSLSVALEYDGPIGGANLNLYRVASWTEPDALEWTGLFQGTGLSIRDIREGRNLETASDRLMQVAVSGNGLPVASALSDGKGHMTFQNAQMLPGLYLLCGETQIIGGSRFAFMPALIQLPVQEGSDWLYHRTAYVKMERQSVPGELTLTFEMERDTGADALSEPEAVLVCQNRILDRIRLNTQEDGAISRTYVVSDDWQVSTPSFQSAWKFQVSGGSGGLRIVMTSVPGQTSVPVRPESPGRFVIAEIHDGRLPQTGLVWWPVYLLSGAGFLLLLSGMGLLRRRNRITGAVVLSMGILLLGIGAFQVLQENQEAEAAGQESRSLTEEIRKEQRLTDRLQTEDILPVSTDFPESGNAAPTSVPTPEPEEGFILPDSGPARPAEDTVRPKMENEEMRESVPEPVRYELLIPAEEPMRADETDQHDTSGAEKVIIEIRGEKYIGILEIPSLSLTLPVRAEWTYAGLKKTPCLFWGGVFPEAMVILAHNYPSHFGNLRYLKPGDPVCFTDATGQRCEYVVELLETLRPEQVESMIQTDYPLTLFTCTPGGEDRVTVRCAVRGST